MTVHRLAIRKTLPGLAANRPLHRAFTAARECDPVTRQTMADTQRDQFQRDGFLLVDNVLRPDMVQRLRDRFEPLFAGEFDTGVYPDEWHWRQGISKPLAFREIVNAWKSDTVVASVVKSGNLGKLACELMGWHGSQVGQDDLLWKPPGASEVAYHQDSAYISTQFVPYENNAVTIWIALDDADEKTGVVEYADGSHKWTSSTELGSSAVDSTFHGKNDYQASLRNAAKQCSVPDFNVTKIVVPAGSAVVHHQDVWHGSGRNITTDIPRRALGIHLIKTGLAWRTSRAPDYIYGRYHHPQDGGKPDPHFFPITYAHDVASTSN